MDQMGEGSSGPGPALPSGAGDDEVTQVYSRYEPVTWPRLADPAYPSLGPPTDTVACQPPTYIPPRQPPTHIPPRHPPTYIPPDHPPTYIPPDHPPTYIPPDHPPTDAAPRRPPTYIPPYPPTDAAPHHLPTYISPRQPSSDVVRFGPGVPATPPASQAGPKAERVWRTGRLPEPPRRPARLRWWFGSALTVILLAASGVVLYLRFHHAPFYVTGVVITQQTKTGCGVDVTGRITTNGAAGTVSYQWLFPPDRQAPRPLNQSVVAGQHAVYVTVAVEGQGHGSASRTVTLQVLGPDPGTASAVVVVSC